MTDISITEQLDAIRNATHRAMQSKESAMKFLEDAGIVTEPNSDEASTLSADYSFIGTYVSTATNHIETRVGLVPMGIYNGLFINADSYCFVKACMSPYGRVEYWHLHQHTSVSLATLRSDLVNLQTAMLHPVIQLDKSTYRPYTVTSFF